MTQPVSHSTPTAPLGSGSVNTRVPLEGDGKVDTRRYKALAPQSLLSHFTPPSPSTKEGKTDRYRLREEVGRGGMGRVVRVEDADLNREIAMKVLLSTDDPTQEELRRFIEEAQITSQLEHPNVLPVHDFGINAEGDVYFTMQFVRSHETLEKVIDRLRDGDEDYHARYSFERRVQCIQQACHALHYAHERGVIHRDIKPANIVLGDHGEVYVVDWGVAKLVDAPERPSTLRDSDSSLAPTKTDEGTWLGTPAYMAPEQVLGLHREVTAATDTYALTAVLYEFLTLNYYLGDVGEKLSNLLAAVANRKPPEAESYSDRQNGRVPRSLSRICRKGLSKRKEERYPSAQALEAALQLWLEGNAPIVCPGTAMQRGLARYSKAIDARPVLLPALSITGGILLLAWLVVATALALT